MDDALLAFLVRCAGSAVSTSRSEGKTDGTTFSTKPGPPNAPVCTK